MTEQYRLKQVSPKEVRFNKQNPRGESEEVIKNDSTFEQLKDSVSKFGVLVPIVVHEKSGADGKNYYTLIDGERRLRAALDTNTEKIPAHVAGSQDRMGELIQAFHIHMLRKQWKPISVAKAFKNIKDELKKQGKYKGDKEFLKELRSQTGCSNKQIEELERAIKYPTNVLDDVSGGKLLWSHLVQFEASFVEQLRQHYPELLTRLGIEKIREILVNKAKQGVIGTTRDLIENILPIVQRAKTAKEMNLAEKLLEQFIKTPDMSPEIVKLFYDKIYPPQKDQLALASEIINKCELLSPMIDQIEVSQIISFQEKAVELRKSLDLLRNNLTTTLRKLNRFMI
jgi:ParB/RepB/Spo0J family partition protein